jgi:hypothetical protein
MHFKLMFSEVLSGLSGDYSILYSMFAKRLNRYDP